MHRQHHDPFGSDHVAPVLAANNFRVLATDGSSAITEIHYGTGVTANYIVQRDANGQVDVPLVPTAPNHAVSLQFLQANQAGLDLKQEVRVATTAALDVVAAGSGVGATLTNNGTQAALSIDGVTLALNDRALIKNQASAIQNGIYTVTVVGDGSTDWELTRAEDADGSPANEVSAGMFSIVMEGTVNANIAYALSGTGDIAVDTDAQNFVVFNAGSELTAGDAISISGGAISVKVDGTTLEIAADQIGIKDNGVSTNKIVDGAVTLSKLADGSATNQIMYWNGSAWALKVLTALNQKPDVVITAAGTEATDGEIYAGVNTVLTSVNDFCYVHDSATSKPSYKVVRRDTGAGDITDFKAVELS